MTTFTQAILLGSERLNTPPAAPNLALADAWAQLDWSGEREVALLEASAILGSVRGAGASLGGPLPAPETASEDTLPLASPRASDVLRRLIAEEHHALLPEWLDLCAQRGRLVPPFYLPTLLGLVVEPDERASLLRVIGERGRWLARQNPQWAWVTAATPSPDPSLWEVGTDDERLASLQHARANQPADGRAMVEKTWSDDSPDFRLRVLAVLASSLSLADEPLLTRALTDRRKELRLAAQAALAALPGSGLAARMRPRAESLLTCSRGLLGRKLEIILPTAFDPAWKADAIEEKPPAGVGEKAHWTQQILSLVPLAHWAEKFGLDVPALITLATKSADWSDLLLGAWFRAAVVHRDSAAAVALLKPLLAHPKALPPGTNPPTAATALLEACSAAERWRLVAAEPDLAWIALPLLSGTPSEAEGRALFEHLWRALRGGLNPGGSPTAVLAARRVPPSLRDEAARRLTADDGLSKPAEAFLQALDLRAEMHTAFSAPASSPRHS